MMKLQVNLVVVVVKVVKVAEKMPGKILKQGTTLKQKVIR